MTDVTKQLGELRNEMTENRNELLSLVDLVKSMAEKLDVHKGNGEDVIERLAKLQKDMDGLGTPKTKTAKTKASTQPVKQKTFPGPTQYFKAQYIIEKNILEKEDGSDTPLMDELNKMTRGDGDIEDFVLNHEKHKAKILEKAEGKMRTTSYSVCDVWEKWYLPRKILLRICALRIMQRY